MGAKGLAVSCVLSMSSVRAAGVSCIHWHNLAFYTAKAVQLNLDSGTILNMGFETGPHRGIQVLRDLAKYLNLIFTNPFRHDDVDKALELTDLGSITAIEAYRRGRKVPLQ